MHRRNCMQFLFDSLSCSANHQVSIFAQGSAHPLAAASSSFSKTAIRPISRGIGVDHPKAAVVAIDLHRGHLDMAVATMAALPEVAARVIAANKRLFDWCRGVGIPATHHLPAHGGAE